MPLRIQPQIQLQTTATEHEMMITVGHARTHTVIVTRALGFLATTFAIT